MSRSRPSSNGRMEPILILIISAVRSPILMPRRSRRCMAMASSMRLPAKRRLEDVTMPPERDDGHLGGAAADVDDHGAGRLGDGQVGAHGSGHRLLDQIRLAGTSLHGGLEHRALLNRGGAARNADDDAGLGLPRVLARRGLVDERADHSLGHVIVGHHAVMQRVLGRERVGRMVDHVLRLVADGQDAMGALLDCDDGGLVDDDAFAREWRPGYSRCRGRWPCRTTSDR